MDLRYMDPNNIVHKPEPKQLIMAYDCAKEVSIVMPKYFFLFCHFVLVKAKSEECFSKKLQMSTKISRQATSRPFAIPVPPV